MKKLNQAAILTGLTQAMINNTPIKLVINGNPDPYFGNIREITNDKVTIEGFDWISTENISEITNFFS